MSKSYINKQLKVYEKKLQLIEKLLKDINDQDRINKLIKQGFYFKQGVYSSIEEETLAHYGKMSMHWYGLKVKYEAKINYYKEKLK